ncbi:hypothetical protein HYQ46_000915 [Verticillium longisporum]|nr:hypothetical protein HYQ46_000915 [Verticillium longisporum]
MLWHSLGELALANNGRGEDRVRGGDTGGDNQTVKPADGGDSPPDKEAHDKPAKCHDGKEEQDDGPPVFFHVKLGQLYADGETLDNEDDSGELEGDQVDIAPTLWIDQVCGMWSKDDATKRGNGGFSDVHALLDERGAEHEYRGEATKDNVYQVGTGDREVVPRHRAYWFGVSSRESSSEWSLSRSMRYCRGW